MGVQAGSALEPVGQAKKLGGGCGQDLGSRDPERWLAQGCSGVRNNASGRICGPGALPPPREVRGRLRVVVFLRTSRFWGRFRPGPGGAAIEQPKVASWRRLHQDVHGPVQKHRHVPMVTVAQKFVDVPQALPL